MGHKSNKSYKNNGMAEPLIGDFKTWWLDFKPPDLFNIWIICRKLAKIIDAEMKPQRCVVPLDTVRHS